MNRPKLTAAVLVVSDTASRDPSTDKCGPLLKETFAGEESADWDVVEVKIVPDSPGQIQSFIVQHSDGGNAVNLIVSSGGTGFAVADRTPEVCSTETYKGIPFQRLVADMMVRLFRL